jgi:hypothetical protein
MCFVFAHLCIRYLHSPLHKTAHRMYTEEQVVPVYRKFVNQHYRLSAYLHTNGANSVDGECMKSAVLCEMV